MSELDDVTFKPKILSVCKRDTSVKTEDKLMLFAKQQQQRKNKLAHELRLAEKVNNTFKPKIDSKSQYLAS